MNQPLISIIIPIYNVESYLRRCLDSIIKQTYTYLEIILVDDGSPDGCPKICDEYATIDNRITVIHKKNGGLSDARNAGLDICKGDYISFVDSDDWINERYIETLLNHALKEDADIVIGENSRTKSNKKTEIHTFSSKKALLHLFKKNHLAFTVSWGKLYKKKLFYFLRFPLGKYHEDEFTTYILFYNSKKIVYSSEILYYYYQRENSIVATRHPWDVLEFLEQRYIYFKEKNEVDLLPYTLPPLCWQLLCAYWYDYKHGKKKGAYYKHSFNKYIQDLKKLKIPFFHRFFLNFFKIFPYTYFIYKEFSPFLLRKNF